MRKLKKLLIYTASSILKRSETKNIIKYLSRKTKNVEVYELESAQRNISNSNFDLIISIGGDGVFISASKFAFKKSLPILGINYGRLGFLADLDKKDFQSKISEILNGNYIIDKRTLLSGYVSTEKKDYKSIAVNDIVINNFGKLRMIEMDVYVNENLINKQRSDGIIIASPTGSTAYAMSNGCPIVSPQSNVICIVPVSPHSYGQRSIIINNNDSVIIKINKKSIENSQVTFDGYNNLTVENPSEIKIKKSSKQLKIVHPCDYDYFNALSKKLRYEIKS